MSALLALSAILIGWALFTRRLRSVHLPPLLFALGAGFIAIRGHPIIGLAGIALAAAWFQGMRMRLAHNVRKGEISVERACVLLGVSRRDNADTIRAAHRALIAQNHPDKGGQDTRAAELNQARDLLLKLQP
jgi:hypothetical protein